MDIKDISSYLELWSAILKDHVETNFATCIFLLAMPSNHFQQVRLSDNGATIIEGMVRNGNQFNALTISMWLSVNIQNKGRLLEGKDLSTDTVQLLLHYFYSTELTVTVGG